jgi:hypothetical protein
MEAGGRPGVEAPVHGTDPHSWPYSRAIDRVVTHVAAANSNVTTEAIAAHTPDPTAYAHSAGSYLTFSSTNLSRRTVIRRGTSPADVGIHPMARENLH